VFDLWLVSLFCWMACFRNRTHRVPNVSPLRNKTVAFETSCIYILRCLGFYEDGKSLLTYYRSVKSCPIEKQFRGVVYPLHSPARK